MVTLVSEHQNSFFFFKLWGTSNTLMETILRQNYAYHEVQQQILVVIVEEQVREKTWPMGCNQGQPIYEAN